jgi:hypothetical protein
MGDDDFNPLPISEWIVVPISAPADGPERFGHTRLSPDRDDDGEPYVFASHDCSTGTGAAIASLCHTLSPAKACEIGEAYLEAARLAEAGEG